MQFVVFKLGNESFAINTNKVQNISEMISITSVPKSPEYIKGLINLRGSIKPLVDIRMLLSIVDNNETENIIILKIEEEEEEEEVGIAVDRVIEVLEIEEDKIKSLENKHKEYVEGVVNIEEDIITIINVDKILNI